MLRDLENAANVTLDDDSHLAGCSTVAELQEQYGNVEEDEDENDGQCDGGCGRMYTDCANSEGADFCMDRDDYLDSGSPASYEAYLKIQGEE